MPPAKKRKKRAASRTTGDVYYGKEPIIIGKISQPQLSKTLTWYNYTQEPEKGHKWLVDYAVKDGLAPSNIKCLKRLNPKRMTSTYFWMAKMMLNGTIFDKETKKRFDLEVKEMINLGNKLKEPEEVSKKKPPNIQERIKEKGQEIISDLEEALDGVWARKEKFSMYDFLQKREVSSQIANMIVEYYQPKLEELNARDAQVKEAYGKDRPRLIKMYEEWFADIDRHTSNRKATKTRKPRRKKEKLAVDVIKRMKFQKEDKALKIVSINPAEIVGCQQLWVYNTKYKQLSVYNASGPAGINVKGTTLTGFDKAESELKTLKKPAEQIAKLLPAGKIVLRKFMSEIKTKPRVPNGRINPNVILLRVVK